MLWVLFSVAIVIAVYFATRFFLLKKAMKEANREFQDILKDIQQNQILHMAMPDKELENMAQSVNQALEQIRTERQEYEKRERAFQQLGIPVTKVNLIGGGAQSEAVRRIAPSVLGLPVCVPEYSEYVADGAARQAAWVYEGGAEPPVWTHDLRRGAREVDGHGAYTIQGHAGWSHDVTAGLEADGRGGHAQSTFC